MKRLFTLSCLLLCYNAFAVATPLVELIASPSANQSLKPGNSALLFYTLRNNTSITLPLTVTLSSANATIANVSNTCGNKIAGLSTCTITVQYNAPSVNQTEPVKVQINYQGRAPLTNVVNFSVSDSVACDLLPLAEYQSPFCQQQYQNVLQFTPNVFNPFNFNVIEEQTLGGMFGIYKRVNNTDFVCYVSCGLRALNGPAPSENTLFELASVTKTFTTSILGKHQFNGTINPLDPVNANLPAGFTLNVNENSVSYQQLATFSGGVCFSDAPSVVQSNPNQVVNQQNFVSDINALDPDPSTQCAGNTANTVPIYTTPPYLPTRNFYSNSSVGLLGQTLMHYEGLPDVLEPDFNNWICNNITNVLSMTMTSGCLSAEALNGSCGTSASSCNFAGNWTSGIYARGYHISAGTYQLGNEFPFLPWAPAGGIRSNAEDMVKFIRANLGFNTNNTPAQLQLIQGMQLAHLPNDYLPVPGGDTTRANIGSQNPLVGGQGYAWVCTTISPSNDRVCGKIGGHENFRSFLGINPAQNYGVIVLFNTGASTTNGSFTTLLAPPSIGVIGTNLMRNVGS